MIVCWRYINIVYLRGVPLQIGTHKQGNIIQCVFLSCAGLCAPCVCVSEPVHVCVCCAVLCFAVCVRVCLRVCIRMYLCLHVRVYMCLPIAIYIIIAVFPRIVRALRIDRALE